MKKYMLFLFFFIAISGFAQQGPNPFAESERNSEPVDQKDESPGLTEKDPGGGNPADPVPIDDYLPLLVIAAAGIIIYKGMRTKQSS